MSTENSFSAITLFNPVCFLQILEYRCAIYHHIYHSDKHISELGLY